VRLDPCPLGEFVERRSEFLAAVPQSVVEGFVVLLLA
jgi:hypothetical protein